jgi:hypothetical protein
VRTAICLVALDVEMPIKSQAERKFLWATNPKAAKKMEADTPKGKKLPKKLKKKKGATK